MQTNTVQSGPQKKTAVTENDESCDRILSKRSIHELVNQVDPLEKLDPEVEEILVDIAEDFVDSITTFGCSLAKHRKSTTLEAKDILLHLERNWNMTLPGFGGDEIKSFRKPLINDVHKERLAAVSSYLCIFPLYGLPYKYMNFKCVYTSKGVYERMDTHSCYCAKLNLILS